MSYRFALEKQDYTHFASGRVFYNAPNQPVLPIRLTSEIFQRCQAIREKSGDKSPAIIYDPCCGSGYHLATLAYFHWEQIRSITASDIDADILKTAEKNLGLLSLAGLDRRKNELEALFKSYQKETHVQALRSLELLQSTLVKNLALHPIEATLFKANAIEQQQIYSQIAGKGVNTVIADVPYGRHAVWHDVADPDPIQQMLGAIRPSLSQNAVCAIITNKGQSCSHKLFKQKGRFQIGKRRVYLLQPTYLEPG